MVVGPEAPGSPQSQVEFHLGLPPGDYYAVIGDWNTEFADEFVVTPGAPGGNYQLDAEDIAVGGALAENELAHIGFTIAPPNVDINDCDHDGGDRSKRTNLHWAEIFWRDGVT